MQGPQSVSLKDLVASEVALVALASEREHPVKVRFKLARLLARLRPVYEAWHVAQRALFEQYGQPVEGGRPGEKSVPTDLIPEYLAAVEALCDGQQEAVLLPTITQDDVQKTGLSSVELSTLGWLVREDDAVAAPTPAPTAPPADKR